jgi:hypothetical protein
MNIHEAVGAVMKVTEEEMMKANEPLAPVAPEAPIAPEAAGEPEVNERPEITPELIDSLIAEMPELADCDKEMLMKGMTAEMEHFDTVGGDINIVAKIACDHLTEFPGKDYYAALDEMEHELQETPEEEEAEHSEEDNFVGGENEGPAETETPAGEAPMESKVTEGKKEDKAAAEAAASITKSATSLLRKIHKADSAEVLRGIEDDIEKSAVKGKINAEQETRLKNAADRRAKVLKENPKAPETEPTQAEEKEIEECVAEKKFSKEPKDDEQSAMKKEANKKEEDRINKKAAEKK